MMRQKKDLSILLMKKLILNNFNRNFFYISILLFVILSLSAQYFGGFTVDEAAQYLRGKVWVENYFIKENVYVNSGLPNEYLRHTDTYGIANQSLSVVISYLLKQFFLIFGIEIKTQIIFHYILHFTSIFFGTLSIVIFFCFLKILNIEKNEAYLASIIFAFSPIWFGQSFFNFMDLNLAFFFLAGSFFLAKINFEKIKKKKYHYLYCLSLVGIGCTRPQVLPIFFIFSLYPLILKKIRIFEFLKYGIFTIFLIYLLTPQAWNSPVNWIYDVYFLNLSDIWRGCTQTNFDCIGKYHSESWSILNYIFFWLLAKLPLPIFISFFFCFFIKDKKQIFLFILFFFPFAIIVFKNLNIYNGLRHILFLIPLIYLISIRNFIFYFKSQKVKFAAFTISFFLLIIDNYSLYPYNYTYLNYLARSDFKSNFDYKNKSFPLKYELDYWGYSLKETVKKLDEYSKSEKIYVDFPKFWDPIILPFSDKLVLKNDKVATYYYISPIYGVDNGRKVPDNCKLIDTTSRKYFLDNKSFHFSYFAKCNKKP